MVNQVYIRSWSFWLTFTALQWMKRNYKISQFSSFLLRYGYAIWVKIWQWPKLLNFSRSSRNHFLIIFAFKFDHFDWLSQLHSQWRQTSKLVNLKISAKVRVCDWGKIWKWLKFLNSLPFIKKTLVNQIYIRIWSFWQTFTVLQWMKKNSKINQFSGFLLMSGYAMCVKIWQWPKLLNFFHSSRKHFWIIFTFKFDFFDWLSQLYSEWRQTSKLVNLKISAKVRICDSGQNLKMTITS